MFSSEAQYSEMKGEFRSFHPYHGLIPHFRDDGKPVYEQACETCSGAVNWNSPYRRCIQCLTETYPEQLQLQNISIDRIRENIAAPKVLLRGSPSLMGYRGITFRIGCNNDARAKQFMCSCGAEYGAMCMCTHSLFSSDDRRGIDHERVTKDCHDAFLIRRLTQQDELTTENRLIPDLAAMVLSYLEEPVSGPAVVSAKRESASKKWQDWRDLYEEKNVTPYSLKNGDQITSGNWVYRDTGLPIPDELYANFPADPWNMDLSVMLESR
jgi:hypothetical protein